MAVIRGSCQSTQVRSPLSLKQGLFSTHTETKPDPRVHVPFVFVSASIHALMCVCVCFMFSCLCVYVPAWENRLNLIYSPRGHLLTESTPLPGPRRNGSFTRLLLYIAAVMGTSGDSGVADLCPATQIWAEVPNILHTASLHWETPDALQLQRINQSTYTSSPPAACQDNDSSEDCVWGCTVWAYPPPPPVGEITGWMATFLLHSPVPSVQTFRV